MEKTRQLSIMRAAQERSFWLFFLHGFGARYHCLDNPEDNWIYRSLHKQICDWLDMHLREWIAWRRKGIRRRKRIMLEIFRGGGKSTISCALDLYIQILARNTAQVITSYDIKKSQEFLDVNKTVMEGDAKYGNFKHLWGVWAPQNEERIWQKEKATTMWRDNPGLRDPSFSLTSVSRGMTGARPDVFRNDDPIVQEKLTEEKNWVQRALTHQKASVYAVKTNGLYILDLTPYVEGDVADKVWQEDGVRSVTGQTPRFKYKESKTGWDVFYMPIRHLDTNESMMPNIYPEEVLLEMEETDPANFAAQMMCDPASGSHMPLTMKDIKHLWIPPGTAPAHLERSIHCDTAYKDAKSLGRGDNNVIQEWGHARDTGKVFYLWGAIDRTWGAREFMTNLTLRLKHLFHEKNSPFVITIDKAPGGTKGAFEEQLLDACRRAGIPCPPVLELPRTHHTKDTRIRQAVYYWKDGRVRLVRGAPGVNTLAYEMTHIGYSAQNDCADAGADVFHPEVYMVAPGQEARAKPPASARPFDKEMWMRPGDEIPDDPDAVDWDEFLQSRYTT